MRAFRFGPALALAAAAALGGNTANVADGGPAFDRAQTDLVTREYDLQLQHVLETMIASSEIGPDGKVIFNRALGDARFLEPNSGYYWQISGEGHEDFRSRSLWDRRLEASGGKTGTEPVFYDSAQYPHESLRVVEHTVRLPGSDVEWQFVVARASGRQPN